MFNRTPKWTIRRYTTAEAAHSLPNVPEGHKCAKLHGHSYVIEIAASATRLEKGFVADFAVLDRELAKIRKVLDHAYLNEIPGLENPTSEVIAAWVAERIELPEGIELDEVTVRESPHSSCTLRWERPHLWV